MRPEWFATQARLLSTTRPDGHRASAQDTDNSFEYRTGVGWTQLVPVGGLDGQPLVVSGDRGQAVYDTSNRLVPTGGTAGELTTIDQFGQTVLQPIVGGGGITMPVDFSDGASHQIANFTIPGGTIGPNGFLRMTAFIEIITSAGTITFDVNCTLSASLPGVTSRNITISAGDTWYSQWVYLLTSNDVSGLFNSAAVSEYLLSSHAAVGSKTSTATDPVFHSADSSADLANDQPVFVTIDASPAVTGTALVRGFLVEHGYGT